MAHGQDLDVSILSTNSDINLGKKETEKLQEQIKSLETELLESKTQVTELTNKVNLLLDRKIFDEVETEMKRLIDEVEELKSNLKVVSDEKEQLEKQNKDLKSVIKESGDSAIYYDSYFKELTDKNKDLQNKINISIKQQKEIKNGNKELQEQLDTKTQEIESITSQLKEVTRENKELQNTIKSLTTEKEEITKDNDEISNEFSEVIQENKSLKIKLENTQQELEEVKHKFSSLESEIVENNENIKPKIVELEEFNKYLTTELGNLKEEYNKLTKENVQLKKHTISSPQTTILQNSDLIVKKLFLHQYQSKNGIFKSFLKWVVKKIFRVEIFKEWNMENITEHPNFESEKVRIKECLKTSKGINLLDNQLKLTESDLNSSIKESFDIDLIRDKSNIEEANISSPQTTSKVVNQA
ncbi:hypothetical protein [Spiroplasma sp. AdecLV25b]|uniref:hypothetical protein n=1 Tax=Spiroplasma sp. AdecLV25b TaxID=3027162 RepID=UPI0027E101B0|nr:hypothetical protein [Spiroplasma sp. AdecLV25b]